MNEQLVPRPSNPLYSPTKAAREWAQRRGRANDAMLIEAWTTGWNARCVPEEPGALADHLRSMLLDGTVQCPLCGKTGPHPHSPEEIVIYRNGVKYGRSLKSASDETLSPPKPETLDFTPCWTCPACGTNRIFHALRPAQKAFDVPARDEGETPEEYRRRLQLFGVDVPAKSEGDQRG